MDTEAAYRATRERITELVGADVSMAETVVPSCPEWTVREVVAHLSGVCADILAGNIAAAGTDAWTAAQVADRAEWSLPELLAEWTGNGPKVEAALGEHLPPQLVFDTVSHEIDLQGALGSSVVRDGSCVELGLEFAIGAMGQSISGNDLPALRVRTDERDDVLGSCEPAATLTAPSYDVLRSFSGRRSADQIRALDWGGADADRWLPAFTYGPFRLPDTPVDA